MSISKIEATFHCDIKIVWHYITSLSDYAWRSDIESISVIESGKQFIEYSKEGYETRFTIIAFEPYRCYQLTMENDNMQGCWIGLLQAKEGTTIIEFKEDVKAKKVILKPFVKLYLKMQQRKYINDLTQVLKSEMNRESIEKKKC